MGAARPLASSLALALALGGADVAVSTATADAEEAFTVRRLAKRISDLGRRSLAESVDMSIATNVQVSVRQVAKALGRIDTLVLAPDAPLTRPSERLSDADWARTVNLNLSAVFYACRGVAREMLRQEAAEGALRGRIVLLTPPLEASPEQQDSAYVAAKAGAIALVQSLGREWASSIAVNAIEASLDEEDESVTDLVLRLMSEGADITGRLLRPNEEL
jgi:3-oxoacyl-[acyl-carrier protein] reductase